LQKLSGFATFELGVMTERQAYQAVNDLNFEILNFAYSVSKICMGAYAIYNMPTMPHEAKFVRYKC